MDKNEKNNISEGLICWFEVIWNPNRVIFWCLDICWKYKMAAMIALMQFLADISSSFGHWGWGKGRVKTSVWLYCVKKNLY